MRAAVIRYVLVRPKWTVRSGRKYKIERVQSQLAVLTAHPSSNRSEKFHS